MPIPVGKDLHVARIATLTRPPVFARTVADSARLIAVGPVAAGPTDGSNSAVAKSESDGAPTSRPIRQLVLDKSTLLAAELRPRMENIKLIDPAFAARLAGIVFATSGVPREQLAVPILESGEFGPSSILEEPKDPAQKFYVASYKIAEAQTTEGWHFAIRFSTKGGPGAELVVELAKESPSSAPSGAKELPHEVGLLLRYKQRVNGVPSVFVELPFTQTSLEEGKVRGTAAISSLAKRNEVLGALTDAELACTLIVRCKAQVGVPAGSAQAQIRDLPEAAARPIRDLPRNVILEKAAVGRFSPNGMRRPILKIPNNRLLRERLRANNEPPIENVPVKVFRQTERVIDFNLPFYFKYELHSYIFAGIGSVVGTSSGLQRRQINWREKSHVYYQSEANPSLFYYIPDTFKLARRPAIPHAPLMSVRFDSQDGTKEKTQATISYCAVPVTSRERLASAIEGMTKLVPKEVLAEAGGIDLEPLLPDPSKMHLKLAVPGSDTREGPFTTRGQAAVDLRSGIVDSLTIGLDEFRALFDALFSTGQLLFSGSVGFEMGGVGEEIPFQLRFHDTAEPFASWTIAEEGEANLVTLTNEIESTLRVGRLDAIVNTDGIGCGFELKPLTPVGASKYPVEIRPSESSIFRLDGTKRESFDTLDLSWVDTAPSKDVIYDLILDASAPPFYFRTIKVKSFKQIFEAPPAPEDSQKQIMAIVVDFDDGTTVELDAEHLEDDNVRLSVPLTGFILGQEESNTYRYKLTIARLNSVSADENWRTNSSGILFVNPGAGPG